MTKFSPCDIEVLLHCYYSPKLHPRDDTPAVQASYGNLMLCGLIESQCFMAEVDTTNLNNVGQILDYLKTKFEFILTISHLTEIKQYCDKMIGLKKDDKGYSKICV